MGCCSTLPRWPGPCRWKGVRGNLGPGGEAVGPGARPARGTIRTGEALRGKPRQQQGFGTDGRSAFRCRIPLSFAAFRKIHGAAEAAFDLPFNLPRNRIGGLLADNSDDRHKDRRISSRWQYGDNGLRNAMDTLRSGSTKVIRGFRPMRHPQGSSWPGLPACQPALRPNSGAVGGGQFMNSAHIAGPPV